MCSTHQDRRFWAPAWRTVDGLGRERPTLFLSNNLVETARALVIRYAGRNGVEDGLGQSVNFFHLDCLAIEVRLNVDLDATLTVLGHGCYRWLAQSLKGFEPHCSEAGVPQVRRDGRGDPGRSDRSPVRPPEPQPDPSGSGIGPSMSPDPLVEQPSGYVHLHLTIKVDSCKVVREFPGVEIRVRRRRVGFRESSPANRGMYREQESSMQLPANGPHPWPGVVRARCGRQSEERDFARSMTARSVSNFTGLSR